jgi:glycerol-3-phosphate dehydrogenase
MKALGEKYGVDLPLTNAVYEICYGESDKSYRERCEQMLNKLFARDTKSEFYS